MNFTNEGRESEESLVATDALALDIIESRLCQVVALLLLAMTVTSFATNLPPIVLLELLAQAAFDRPVEAGASFMGVLGTLLLATKGKWAAWGWVVYLVSNAGWLWFAHSHGFAWMFWQQVAFTVSSLLGVAVWIVMPRLRRAWVAAPCGVVPPVRTALTVGDGRSACLHGVPLRWSCEQCVAAVEPLRYPQGASR